jgi:hypothetical protein
MMTVSTSSPAPETPATSAVDPRRLTVRRDEGFVVFLIGARFNRWWMLPAMWAVAAAMNRMMRELLADPSSGLLSYESYGGRTTLMLQYWRSIEDLHRYARNRQRQHVPAWRAWIQKWGRGAVGIWHETYVVEPGTYECFYQHMPPFGFGKVGPRVPADGPLKTSAGRLGRRAA